MVTARPLCMDLDGTLHRSDMLYESVCHLLKANPLYLFCFPLWILGGLAAFKRKVAERIDFDPAVLPYIDEALKFTAAAKAAGRRIVLATASDRLIADKVARHLGCFDEVIASDGITNYTGRVKAQCLVEKFGAQGFDYGGDRNKDLEIWPYGHTPVVVTANRRLAAQVLKRWPEAQIFLQPSGVLEQFVRALRTHQWVKNLLIFAPLIMAHHWRDSAAWLRVGLAFGAFCLTSSSVYVLNDLLDLESDRHHRQKRDRPFASGRLSVLVGMLSWPLLLAMGVLLGSLVYAGFLSALFFYWALTLCYSLKAKQIMVLDICVLASLYTMRVLAGGYAGEVVVSEWLLAFSMFMFFSLACIKRFSELYNLRKDNKERIKGRAYRASDLEQISQFGSASAYISVLVLALYVSSAEIRQLYSNPQVLWLVCPVLLYWLSRIWLIAHRGELHEDPIVFAISDLVSYISGLLCLLVVILAI